MSDGMDATTTYEPLSLDWRELGSKILRAAYVATVSDLCARDTTAINNQNSTPEHKA